MQKLSTLIIALATLCVTTFAANSRIIENPVYEFKTTGIPHITKIELNENETRLHIHTIFVPYRWTSFSSEAFIEDSATGERWQPIEMIGGEFDEQIFMPASGDSTFVLIFPPLDESVTKINFIHVGSIYGISLNPETQPRRREIPDDVLQWIDNELAQARRQTMMNFEAGEFFAADTARLVGYIRGFDRRAGFSTGMIFDNNAITRESNPVMVQIHEDGRFEAIIPMSYPIYSRISFTLSSNIRVNIPFYIQPGQTLAMLLDWDEFLMADRLRFEPYTFKNIQFKGATADINRELHAFNAQMPAIPARQISDVIWSGEKTPDEFKSFLYETMLDYNSTFQRLLETENLSEVTKNLLRNDNLLLNALYLLNFAMGYSRDGSGELPIEFFSFLQNIPMNNRELLSSPEFSQFINRFEFNQLFSETHREISRMFMPEIPFDEYLFEELNIPRTPEDENFLALHESVRMRNFTFSERDLEGMALLEEWNAAFDKLRERYQEHFDTWQKKYVDVIPQLSPVERELKRWRMQDFIYTHVLNLEPGIVYDVVRVRSLNSRLQNMSVHSREHDLNVLIGLVGNIPEPFLRQEAARMFIQNLPAVQQQVGEELPDTYAANIFRELIAPFRGKMVLVNFWATTCGPCIATIREQKALRERYKDSADIAFIFITSERASPLNSYHDFVNDQELIHSFRIPDTQYNHLMQLFRFMGIPHYVLVDRQGRILSNDFRNARMLNVSAPLLPQLQN